MAQPHTTSSSRIKTAILLLFLSFILYVVSVRHSGLFQPPLCGLIHHFSGDIYGKLPFLASVLCPKYEIYGTVAPGWEKVKQIFENNFKLGNEKGAQLSIYVKGKEVVHLWGNAEHEENYNHDSLQVVWSTTKAVTSLCVAMLVDRGHLRYDAKVAEYWPEFAQNGKQNVLVSDVLRHRAGLSHFDETLSHEIVQNLDELAQFLAKQPQRFPNHTKQAYHAITRGFVLNEIFRRADPQHRTIGEFVRQEIALPLGVDYSVGIIPGILSPAEIDQIKQRLVSLRHTSSVWSAVNLLLPFFLGGKIPLISPLPEHLDNMFRLYTQPDALIAKVSTVLQGLDGTAMSFQKRYLDVEVPSANGITSGFALAKIFAIVANGGEIDGKRLISEQALQQALLNYPAEIDGAAGVSLSFTQGGWAKEFLPGMKFGGWGGWGGSLGVYRLDKNISLGYAMNGMGIELLGNTNCVAILKVVNEIADQLE